MDLDKRQKERVNTIVRRMNNGDDVFPDELFVSERVIDTIDVDKTIINSFKVPELLSLLPFSPIIYVEICPSCVSRENFHVFRSLVNAEQIIPILISRYHDYPDVVVDVVKGRHHISVYEYDAYRTQRLFWDADGGLCSHCTKKYAKTMRGLVKGKKGSLHFRRQLNRLMDNIHPFVYPDFEILDEMENAFSEFDREKAEQVSDLSETICYFRTGQAFNAALLMKESDFSRVPSGVTNETDHARLFSLQLKKLVSEGLGIKIPIDINMEQYLELVSDFRPYIMNIHEDIFQGAMTNGSLSFEKLLGEIEKFNGEITKIKGLKRYMLYEACVEIVSNNKTLAISALVAGALGLVGSLGGCIGAMATGAAAQVAKKKGKLPSNKSMARLGRKIHRDLQPNIDSVIAKYVGADIPAIRILSIRRALSETE